MTKAEFKKCFLSIINDSVLLNDDDIKALTKIFKLKEKPQLTERERAYLKAYSYDYEWVARDKIGGIYGYITKPHKEGNCYFASDEDCMSLPDDNMLSFIKWEDEEPYKIKDLLGEE